MKFPFDELSMRNLEHVEWVKSQRDPELWHVAAMALLVSGDPHGFLVWLFDQPEVDRATAGYVFLGAYERDYLGGKNRLRRQRPIRSGMAKGHGIYLPPSRKRWLLKRFARPSSRV